MRTLCLVGVLGLAACSGDTASVFCAVDEVPCADGCCRICYDDDECDPGFGCCDNACSPRCDHTPPVVGVDDTSVAWRSSASPSLTLSVEDSQSAIGFAHLWWDSGSALDFDPGDTTTIPSDGVHDLHLQAGDVAGNVSQVLTSTYRLCSAGGWYVSAADACVVVEAGFYSPANDLARYPCPSNHWSSPGATSCTLTCLETPAVFAYTGAAVDWEVPEDCDIVEIKVWGAGGGRADYGGAGGFSVATFDVTPGELLSVRVGGLTGVFGGGAGSAGDTGGRRGGNGGDYSGVFRDDTPLIMAGGGGGGAASPHSSVGRSGAGGGITGGETGGITGGTQTEGGTGSFGGEGSELSGGDADYGTTGRTYGGGGGGGGWFGGGGGHTGDSWGTGGGAGSGCVPTGGPPLQGSEADPPMTTDPDYADEAGTPDHEGRIVIRRGN